MNHQSDKENHDCENNIESNMCEPYCRICKKTVSLTWQEKDREEWYIKVKPFVEKMKEKYPFVCNIEGLEPALTSDISEIVFSFVQAAREEAYNQGYDQWFLEKKKL